MAFNRGRRRRGNRFSRRTSLKKYKGRRLRGYGVSRGGIRL